MKIISTLAFCGFIAPGLAFGMGPAQKEHDKDHGWTTTQANLDRTSDGFLNSVPKGSVSVANLIGSSVKGQIDNEEIGTIKDILIDSDGTPLAVIVSVGGFLGIGDKDVALGWDSFQLSYEHDDGLFSSTRTTDDDYSDSRTGTTDRDQMQRDQKPARDSKPNEYVLVTNLTEDALENAPEFDRDWN